MRYFLVLLLMNYSAFAAQINQENCMDIANTQLAMNECAKNIQKNADNELTKVYLEIKEKYKNDSVFIKKLIIAQRAWIKYRDAQLDMIYPHSTEQHYYGSVLPMCIELKLTDLTNERIKTLKQWLTRQEEGNACNGSSDILPPPSS